MAKSKVYTKRGDKGYTSLVSGNQVLKSDIRLESYGQVDELNSFIACLIDEMHDPEDHPFLLRIQYNLFSIGGYLADDSEQKKCSLSEKEVELIEKEIDRIDELLPPLKRFVLPGGCKANSLAHVCRTVCRRAERAIYRLQEETELDSIVLQYMNRLSDYFFLFSRKQSIIGHAKEIFWENPCS
jgi:ATP:cob(I)alamin adenosyltransferase